MIKESIKKFLEKSDEVGQVLNKDGLESLNSKLDGLIPEWYIEIVCSMPLAGLNVGWQAFPPEDDFNGVEEITILDTSLLNDCNIESYPGKYLLKIGYFTFGYGSNWSRNCFVFNPLEGSNPPVYEVWHDVAQSPKDMLLAIKEKKGVSIVATKFSELFDSAVFESST
ncbi:hypothetical protein [Bacterioplanoides sp.]|uniref:hypothetical protein n=1 Tax=Bacterioplanoides sp. TaxID=2066072 RepID=UPI003B00BE9E